ncbi:MAG: monovalent cation/H(+) antiporter subunit G [Candidatus Firestonebacteria bacterium]|nr:monovalent cation/H(+) antiporter subunit G [Candidatus Firestonebacteria bacterium]
MIEIVINSLTIPLIFVGVFFFIIGTVGLLRFPDIYCRIHATTKCDTLGAGAILIAVAIYEHNLFVSLKLIAICFLVFVYSPTIGHIVSRTAYRTGIVPWKKKIDISFKDTVQGK